MKLSQPIHQLKRQARVISRREGIPLHAALDRVARGEGFPTWSMLADRMSDVSPALDVLSELEPGDMLLLAGRPGQGKTALSIEMAIRAMRQGTSVVFFTLEFTEAQVHAHIRELGDHPEALRDRLDVDTADEISAAYIIGRLDSTIEGTVVVIDYLQVLDQRRENPPLSEQVASLGAFARSRGIVIICLSQVDRSFEASGRSVPGLVDVRLPNPVDLSLFSKVCFIHEGRLDLASLG